MCGRFVLFTSELLGHVGELPGVEEVHAPDGVPRPRYNIAPTMMVPVVRVQESLANVEPARWGLLPHWKKDLDGPPLFNARGETVASKPSFLDAYKGKNGSGRCLIPMNGYYEWHEKVPHYVSRPDGKLMWVAGLWSSGLDRLSATMVTTEALEPMDWLHNRLPRFLLEEEMRPWLEGDMDEDLLQPSPKELRELFEIRPVDKAVGNVRNDYPELIG
ncbi:MAG: SOS response-associated peptidase [Corynebacterium casei]|uniref:SOS response-associated peptidase n=1 Tax=Corynebacterium casei TaxID=160386 RepID=UPI000BF17910|nr:SOS response-associated peptidase [Corynebacterium casei]